MTLTNTGHCVSIDARAGVFEERAEHLSKEELETWSPETARDKEVLAKLKGPGPKLLVGPRGSGKSTLLRKAYFALLDSDTVLGAYINFAKSLALEPLFHRRANALQIFRQWVVFKLIDGVAAAFDDASKSAPDGLSELALAARSYINDLEAGVDPSDTGPRVAPSQLLLLLEQWTDLTAHRRCVLLLDDAAHAFSPEQQREFFEIFRSLRSRVVSAKAAVYPGITSYSPNFHVGHEAELVEAWYQPESDDYLNLMRSIVATRLPAALTTRLGANTNLTDYLGLASFGLPRGFITMLSQLLGVEEEVSSRPSRKGAESAVSSHSEIVMGIFTSLADKLPRYRRFVSAGNDALRNMIQSVRQFNHRTDRRERATAVALHTPISAELERILAFMEYAGVVRKLDTISRGHMGVYQRYAIHYALLLKENALSLGASYSIDAAISSLQTRSRHALAYIRENNILNDEARAGCILDLPPCQNCGAERVAEEAKFCMSCGRPLVDRSVYDELLQASVDKLPLTQRKIDDIRSQTSIRTVQDILLDTEMKQIRQIRYVGDVWATRIRNAAEEFVSV